MILAQLTPEMTKGIPYLIVSVGALLWIYNEGRKAFRRDPNNETLGEGHKSLSARMGKTENSIRNIYADMSEMKDDLTHEMQEQKSEIIAAADRRHESINEQFKDIAATLARLDERSKQESERRHG